MLVIVIIKYSNRSRNGHWLRWQNDAYYAKLSTELASWQTQLDAEPQLDGALASLLGSHSVAALV